eukprot:SAG31_NODE_1315_length_8849_cov_809.105943_3_plen_464_part_00
MAQSEAEMVRAIHRQHAAHMDERVAQIAELEAFRDAHLSAASTTATPAHFSVDSRLEQMRLEHQAKMTAADSKLAELNDRLQKKQETLLSMSSTCENLTNDILQKDEQLGKVQQNCTALTKNIKDKESRILQKDELLDKLQRETIEASFKLKSEISERDSQIKDKEETLIELTHLCDKMAGEVVHLEAEVSRMNVLIAKQADLEMLQHQVDEKHGRIVGLTQNHEEMSLLSSKMLTELEQLTAEIALKDALIAEHQNTISSMVSEQAETRAKHKQDVEEMHAQHVAALAAVHVESERTGKELAEKRHIKVLDDVGKRSTAVMAEAEAAQDGSQPLKTGGSPALALAAGWQDALTCSDSKSASSVETFEEEDGGPAATGMAFGEEDDERMASAPSPTPSEEEALSGELDKVRAIRLQFEAELHEQQSAAKALRAEIATLLDTASARDETEHADSKWCHVLPNHD